MTIAQRTLGEQVLGYSRAEATEVLVSERHVRLTRFANGEIHQNVSEDDCEVRVRVMEGGRLGMAATNDLSEASLRAAVERAAHLARYAPPNFDLPALPGPQPWSECPEGFVAATAEASPEQRAESVAIACRQASEAGLMAFGAYETSWGRRTVANSRGLCVTQEATKADFNLVVMSDDSSGFASEIDVELGRLDVEALSREAIDKALRSRHPVAIAPGSYTVLLEEEAVGDLLEHVASVSFGGRRYADGIATTSGKLGTRLFGQNVTIWDEPLDPRMLPVTFDAEGMPKTRQCFVDRGVAVRVAHDLETAKRLGVESTGHAIPGPASYGPMPTRLRMSPGTASKAELLAGIERGIWVTRFHYTNMADARSATITGMTRDGTFLIEDGQIVRPLKNLRFTASGMEALNRVRAIGRDTKLTLGWIGAVRAPAVVVEDFRFSGATAF